MEAVVFAGMGAVALASANTIARRGTRSASASGGAIVTIATGNLLLWTIVIFDPPESVRAGAIPYFLAAGIVGSALGRWAAIGGVHRLGPSTAVPIHASVYPVFAVLGASVFLGEPVTSRRMAGVAAIVLGIVILTRDRDGDRRKGEATRLLAFLYPVVAGLAFGGSDLLRKAGIDMLPEATFAQALGFASALLTFLLLSLFSHRFRTNLAFGRQVGWFLAAGVLNSLGLLSATYALSRGDVSIVSPIVASEPLIVVALAPVLLGDLDRVTIRTMIAAALTVLGVLAVAT